MSWLLIGAPTSSCKSTMPIMFAARFSRLEPCRVCTLWSWDGGEKRWVESRDCSNQKWKNRRGAMIDSCLACCPLRLFPPSTAIINRRSSPSPWQRLCHPSPLEDAIPFGRRWIGVPLPCMRSLCTESLQREHSGVNRLNVNNSIISNLCRKRKKKFCVGLQEGNQQLYLEILEVAVMRRRKQFLNLSFIKGLAELR